MDQIYWVTQKLAGRCGPEACQWDLQALYEAGFRIIVSLDERAKTEEIEKQGFEHFPLYLPDVALTTHELKERFVKAAAQFVRFVQSHTEPILVHCYAGNDRTGAMLACFLISQGKKADEAIAEIRTVNPVAMTTSGYEDAVYLFAESDTSSE
jgi:protein-tyrosine phosphatase